MSLLITAIILTKNEEKNIERCINSIKWCNEIIVIDDSSFDKTTEIARKLDARVYLHPLKNFSDQRNFGLSKANGEWVLFVDADEVASDALAFEILSVIEKWTNEIGREYKGYRISRFDSIWGKQLKYGESGIKLLRLAKKGGGEWVGNVHERWRIKGRTGILKSPLIHYPHQSVAEFIKEINFYTDIRAQELYLKKVKIYWWAIIVYPLAKFVLNLFIRRGFLDGIRGLIFAIVMSFHSFLVRGKLWLLQSKTGSHA